MLKLAIYLRPYRKECILGPFFKLLEAIFELSLPTIMVLIINHGVLKRDQSYIITMGGLMLLLAILGFGSSLICQYYAARTSQGFGTTLRNTIFSHITTLTYSDLDQFGTSSLVNRITNDVNQLQLAVAMLIRLVIRAPFICIGAIIISMILDLKLSLIFLGITPLFGLTIFLIIKKTAPLYRLYQSKLDRITTLLRENLFGIRIIRAFSRTQTIKEQFSQANGELTNTMLLVGKFSSLLNPLTSFIMNAAIITILWAGNFRIQSGTLTQGEIIAFVSYITQILLALIVVANLVTIFTKAFASAARINELLDTEPSLTYPDSDSSTLSNVCISTQGPNPFPKDSFAVSFDHVYFSYAHAGQETLQDISLQIRPFQTVGIIGSTGSGKSTLVHLIPRFYDVTKGTIQLYGQDIKSISSSELQNKISIVPQDILLFSGTILENICFGKETATMEEVIHAAKLAQAHDFIQQLKDGYQSLVSQNGTNLSGGQKQRIAIARALITKPSILILDDSFSALDYTTDTALRSALQTISESTTLLMVSQRISSIKEADQIIVLEHGKIVGNGTHDELLKACTVYQEICSSQLSFQEVPEYE